MKNLIKKTLREHTLTNVDEFKDEIFELPLEQRKSVLRGLETLASVKNQENLEEQIKYGGIPEMKASSTLGKILKCKLNIDLFIFKNYYENIFLKLTQRALSKSEYVLSGSKYS